MSKRKYVKRSDYWKKFGKSSTDNLSDFLQKDVVSPSSAGEPYYIESFANYSRSQSSSEDFASRRNKIHKSDKKFRFSNISGGMLPYVYGSDGVNVRDTIELCQKLMQILLYLEMRSMLCQNLPIQASTRRWNSEL